MIHTFTGYRPSPPEEYKKKGITNAGDTPDYQGVMFDDGTVVIRWLTQYRSHSVWNSWNDFYQVHGHPEYGTRIQFHEWPPPPHDYVPYIVEEPNIAVCNICGLNAMDDIHAPF